MLTKDMIKIFVAKIDERDWNYTDESVPIIDVRDAECYPGLMIPMDGHKDIFYATISENGLPYRGVNSRLSTGHYFLASLVENMSHRLQLYNGNDRNIMIEPTGTVVQVEKPVGYKIVSVMNTEDLEKLDLSIPENLKYPIHPELKTLFLYSF